MAVFLEYKLLKFFPMNTLKVGDKDLAFTARDETGNDIKY